MTERMCVIGSGPSAVACAHTLWKRGVNVTILDVGLDLDHRSRILLDRFRRDQDARGFVAGIHRLRAGHRRMSLVQPGKFLFGSDHPYRTVRETQVSSGADAVIRSSLAKGGLTTVWGATVSTVVPKDISDWPISFADLEPHYRTLDEIVSVASPAGELRAVFPIDIGSSPTFPLGVQGRPLFERLRRHAEALEADGIHVGRAKLAVGALHSLDGRGCTPCGLCMHGCPNRAIFNAAYVLDDLRQKGRVEYRSGTLVESFSEQGDRVHILARNLNNGERTTAVYDRVFIAGGVVNSTAIVARSLKMTDHSFVIRDSQKYIFPLLLRERSRGAVRMNDNVLAQIYLAVDNPRISNHIVQVQYYGYNDLVLDALRLRIGHRATEAIARLAAPFLERLIIVFVYLHSKESGTLSLRVHESADGSLGEVRGFSNPRSAVVIRELLALLRRHRDSHGGVPLEIGVQATPPGDSQHIGGTLPMSSQPGRYETDVMGRPFSCRRVHVVDASVFPSVPGTPIVYTMMANASRIAASAVEEASERP